VPQFGKYELTTRLAKGGMGETYLAQLNAVAGVSKRVVIKKMLPALAADEHLVEAFIQEARISATLSHGNIAQVFDFGSIDGEYFLAMEYVHGQSLQAVMKRAPAKGYPKLPLQVSTYIAIELLKALHYAHTRVGPNGVPLNLVHRDVTPDNILLSYEGDVKLVDFGVAKAELTGRTETEPGLVKGKYRYFSPEQALADPLDARSDIFAVGIVLHELYSGQPLFNGQMHQVMNAIVRETVPRLTARSPDVPEPLADAVDIALSRSKIDRFPTALAMQEALSRWLFSGTPDFTGDVVRELMGELFGEELAKAGTPFVGKKRATGMLRALKSQTSNPAVKRATAAADVITKPSGQQAVQPAISATTPSAKAQKAPVVAGALIIALGAAGTAVALSAGDAPSEEECVRAAEIALELGATAEVARNVVDGCLGEHSPGPHAQRLLSVIEGCAQQLTGVMEAQRAMDRGELEQASRHLAFRPLPCASRQRQAAERRLVELRPEGAPEGECLQNGQRALEAGSPAHAARTAVMTCLNGRTPSPTARGEMDKYERCAAQLARFTEAEQAIDEGRLEDAATKLKAESLACATARLAEVNARYAAALERRRDAQPPKAAPPARPLPAVPSKLAAQAATQILDQAREAMKQRDYPRARDILQLCVRSDPNNAECWKMMGVVLGQMGDGDGGARAYQRFLELAPNHPQAPKVREILRAYWDARPRR